MSTHAAAAQPVLLFPSRLGGPARRPAPLPRAGTWLATRLAARHAELEDQILRELSRPRPDLDAIRALKREKLQTRDRMASLVRDEQRSDLR